MSIEFSRWPNNYMMSYQVTKALGLASLGAADVTEIYEACKKIDPNDKETWHREWLITADALKGMVRRQKRLETGIQHVTVTFVLAITTESLNML